MSAETTGIQGDITSLDVGAIVSAAHTSLLGGGRCAWGWGWACASGRSDSVLQEALRQHRGATPPLIRPGRNNTC